MSGLYYDISKNLEQPTIFLSNRGSKSYKHTDSLGHFYSYYSLDQEKPGSSKYGTVLIDGLTWQKSEKTNPQIIADQLTNNLQENLELIRSIRGVPAIVVVTEQYVIFTRCHVVVKPLHYVYEPEQGTFAVSSSTQDLQNIHGNFCHVMSDKIYVYNKNTKYIDVYPYHNWNLKQNIDSWDDVFDKWQHVMHMCRRTDNLYMISSGTESGLMCGEELQHTSINVCYMLMHRMEDSKVLNERFKLHKSGLHIVKHNSNFIDSAENRSLDIWANHVYGDNANPNIFKQVYDTVIKPKKFAVVMQGIGADAPFADHGIRGFRTRKWSIFGGVFPTNLEEQFPWYYPWKPAHTEPDVHWGMYGVNTQSPFMDLDLMQAFMRVDRKLKNANYKNWETLRLDQLGYPYSLTKAGIWGYSPLIQIKG